METTTQTWDGPSNEESEQIKQRVASLIGTPAWSLFLRWDMRSRIVRVQSSSGSTLATVNLEKDTVTISPKLGGQTVSLVDA